LRNPGERIEEEKKGISIFISLRFVFLPGRLNEIWEGLKKSGRVLLSDTWIQQKILKIEFVNV